MNAEIALPDADSGAVRPKPTLMILVVNHFDLVWRRCWDQRYDFKGRRFASASDIEDAVITDSLAFARRDRRYRFSIESTAVVRQYLRRHPERLAELRRLVAQGRVHISGAGDNIVDGNMLLGESLVRNFVNGYLWNEAQFGLKTVLATRGDAFGNSAQLPQILRGCGVAWVESISYSPVKGQYWRGLDGSTVFTGGPAVAGVGGGGGFDNLPPCPKCAGQGCRACKGRGIDLKRLVRLNPALDESRLAADGRGMYWVVAEELLPNPELLALATRWSRQYDVRFVNMIDFLEELRPRIAQADQPPADALHPSPELNPNNTGCYVSRIKIKQAARRTEYALLGAEALWSLASLAGYRPPAARFERLWEDVLLTLFHDAITGTHTDPAYAELRGIQDRVERDLAKLAAQAGTALAKGAQPRAKGDWITVFNPVGASASSLVEAIPPSARLGQLQDEEGQPVPVVETLAGEGGASRLRFVAEGVPPLGSRRYRFVKGRAPAVTTVELKPGHGVVETIANRRFEVKADANGIVAIRDRLLGRDIATAGAWHPNEAILERDEGSSWATLSPDLSRTGLAPHTRLVAVDRADRFQRLRFVCEIPYAVDSWGGRIESTVTLTEGLHRVDFHARVRWGNFNRRLRFAMPVPFAGHAVYGIPYGQLQRERYEPAFDKWAAAGGDWPAVDWVGVESPDASVALLTRGLPSFDIGPEGEGYVILLSVLRSPTIPTYLHQPWHLVMTDWDGMRDEDYHDFDYALGAYGSAFPASVVVADAESFNAGMTVLDGPVAVPVAPRVEAANVRLGALKPAHDGRGLVLRLWEFRGLGGEATIRLPPDIRQAERCNLLEREGIELSIREGSVTLHLHPWEITTVRLVLDRNRSGIQNSGVRIQKQCPENRR